MARPLLLVDTAGLYFRAFYAIPESVARATDGTPVNAVRGFVDMLATLIRTRRPDRLTCALDTDWRPAWRVALIDSYKAHRAGPDGAEQIPGSLGAQVPVIVDILDAVGIPAVGAPGYEADDVIATLAAREPGPVEVATGDRDLFQVIDDERGVRVLYCGRGIAKLDVYDAAALRQRYGVTPEGYADFATLRGDPSDGLSGVPGVGDKSAARLIDGFGSLTALLAALDDPAAQLRPALRAKLLAARDYLALAPTVVRVARDVALAPLAAHLPAAPAHPQRLHALAERWAVTSPVRRLVAALAEAGGDTSGTGAATALS